MVTSGALTSSLTTWVTSCEASMAAKSEATTPGAASGSWGSQLLESTVSAEVLEALEASEDVPSGSDSVALFFPKAWRGLFR